MTLDDVAFNGCAAEATGGAIHARSSSRLEVAGSSVMECQAGVSGGGAQLDKESILDVKDATFTANMAGEMGAAVHVSRQAVLQIADCQLTGNVALAFAGGIGVEKGSILVVSDSGWFNNSAQMGGAIAVASDSAVQVEQSVFGRNDALSGGAIYLKLPPREPRAPMRDLRFDSNTAYIGPAIMWEYNATSAPPECIDCTGAGDSLLVSTACSYEVWQGDTPVGAEGVSGMSGTRFSPELKYVALDYYGNVTWRLEETAVTVEAIGNDTLLDGQTIALYASGGGGGAAFDDLTLFAPPNGRFSLVFQPQTLEITLSSWGTVTVWVTLEPCKIGEQYLAEARVCKKCDAGSVKFTNDTQACTLCADFASADMVECYGGGQYSLLEGSWGPRQAGLADCHTHEVVEECVLSRVYRCTHLEGCASSGEPRVNANGSLHVAMEAMCQEGYLNTAVLCGECQDGRYRDLVGGCKKCFVSAWVAVIQLAMLLALLLGLVGMAVLGLRWARRRAILLHTQGSVSQINKPWLAMLGGLLGNLQVIAQTMLIYSPDAVPSQYQQAVKMMSFSFSHWLPLECATNMLGMDSVWAGFYGEFAFYAAMPFAVSAVFIVLPILRLSRANKAHADGPDAPQPDQFAPGRGRAHGDPETQSRTKRPRASAYNRPRGGTRVRAVAHRFNTVMKQLLIPEMHQDGAGAVNFRRSRSRAVAVVAAQYNTQGQYDIIYNDIQYNDNTRRSQRDSLDNTRRVTWTTPSVDCSGGSKSPKSPNFAHLMSAQWEAEMQRLAPKAAVGEDKEDRLIAKAANGDPGAGGAVDEDVDLAADRAQDIDNCAIADLMAQLLYGIYLKILIFLHPVCATYMFALFNCREIHLDSRQYWLVLDTQVECFTSQWWAFCVISVVVTMIYVLSLPCGMAAVPYYLNRLKQVQRADTGDIVYVHERLLLKGPPRSVSQGSQGIQQKSVYLCANPLFTNAAPEPAMKTDPREADSAEADSAEPRYHIMNSDTGRPVEVFPQYRSEENRKMESALVDADWMIVWGSYLSPYKRRYYAWAALEMWRKVATTSVVIMVNFVDKDYGLLYNALATTAALVAHAYCQPFYESLLNQFQLAILLSQNAIVLLCIGERYEGTLLGSFIVGSLIIIIQVVLCGTVVSYYVKDMMFVHSDAIQSAMGTLSRTIERTKTLVQSTIRRHRRSRGGTNSTATTTTTIATAADTNAQL
eukprot:gene16713-19854_t